MNVLNDILDGVREDVAQRMQRVPLEHVKERASTTNTPRDPRPMFTNEDVCVIAEVKREVRVEDRWQRSPIRPLWLATTKLVERTASVS